MTNDTQDDDLDKVNLDEIDTETATPEQVAEVVKTAKTALAQRKSWKTKAIDPETGKPWNEVAAELKAKSLPPKESPPTVPPDDELRKTVGGLQLAEEKRQFGYQHSLSPEETDLAFALADGQKVKPTDILTNDFFKTGLDGLRQKRKTASAIPGSSSRATTVDGKAINLSDPKSVKENWSKITGVE